MDICHLPKFNYIHSRICKMTEVTQTPADAGTVIDRNVRARIVNGYGLIPYDSAVKIPDSVLEVNIEHMMSDNPERKRAIMYLQLIRIVSGSNNGMNNASPYQSFYKKNKKEGSLSSQYYRLFYLGMLLQRMVRLCTLWKERI